MRLFLSLLALTLLAADNKVAISKEDQLKIALHNGRLINARFDLSNKQRIKEFSIRQEQEAVLNVNRVEQEGHELLKKLVEAYKQKGASCSFFNEQAELICTPLPPATPDKKGK